MERGNGDEKEEWRWEGEWDRGGSCVWGRDKRQVYVGGMRGGRWGGAGGFLLNESIFVLRGLLTRPKLNTLFKKPGFKFYLHYNANKYSSEGSGTRSLKYILSLVFTTHSN